MKLIKRDLLVKIARETGFIQNDVAEVVQKTLDYIAEDLIAGNTIELRNFGVFEITDRFRSCVGNSLNFGKAWAQAVQVIRPSVMSRTHA